MDSTLQLRVADGGYITHGYATIHALSTSSPTNDALHMQWSVQWSGLTSSKDTRIASAICDAGYSSVLSFYLIYAKCKLLSDDTWDH